MRAIFMDSYREMLSRKIVWIFAALTLVAILAGYGSQDWDGSITMEGQSAETLAELDKMAGNPALRGVNGYMSFLVFLATMAVAGLFPQMMQRGRADFYLSKPISRHNLYTFRFLSVYAIHGILIVLCGLVSYGALTLISRVYGFSVLWIVGSQMINFFILLALVTVVGILSGSGGVAMMVAFLVWAAQFMLNKEWFLNFFGTDGIAHYVVVGLYYLLPKTSEVADIGIFMAADLQVVDWLPLWSSVLFAFVALWAGLSLFIRRDY